MLDGRGERRVQLERAAERASWQILPIGNPHVRAEVEQPVALPEMDLRPIGRGFTRSLECFARFAQTGRAWCSRTDPRDQQERVTPTQPLHVRPRVQERRGKIVSGPD